MKKYFLIFLIVIFSIIFYFSKSYAEEEKLTIVTYYPSPYGIYNRLVTQTLGVGDTNNSGNIDNSDSPDPATNSGDLWVAGNVTIGTNSSSANRGNLNVKGKVGIGTTTPQAKLDVAGEVKISNTGLNCNSNTAGVLRYNNNQIEYCDGMGWKSMFVRAPVTGSYVGDGTKNRKIDVGFSPTYLIIYGKGIAVPIRTAEKTASMPGSDAFNGGADAWQNIGPNRISFYSTGFIIHNTEDLYKYNESGQTYYYVVW